MARMTAQQLRGAFALDPAHVWLNCAHQGPLPRAGAEAAIRAVEMKTDPTRIAHLSSFLDPVARLRALGARLLGADAADVAVTNSASHGLNLLARGLRLSTGDEVLLLAGAFPATNLPFERLTEDGVKVRLIETAWTVGVTVDQLAAEISRDTRAVALTWVDSFSGVTADLPSIGELCRTKNVALLVNASQGIGARPLDVSETPIDALVTCGYKWLCGPYGTGFTWIHPRLRRRLHCTQANWLAAATDLDATADMEAAGSSTIRAWDGFDTACFNNTLPWEAALELLLEVGIDQIARHNGELVARLHAGLQRRGYEPRGPRDGSSVSAIVPFSHRDPSRNPSIWEELERQKIWISLRRGMLRASPHAYNTAEEIDRLIDALPM